MDFESIREEILLGRGQENLKLKPKQKEGLQCYFLHTISCKV